MPSLRRDGSIRECAESKNECWSESTGKAGSLEGRDVSGRSRTSLGISGPTAANPAGSAFATPRIDIANTIASDLLNLL